LAAIADARLIQMGLSGEITMLAGPAIVIAIVGPPGRCSTCARAFATPAKARAKSS
jgi:hypothetical protein